MTARACILLVFSTLFLGACTDKFDVDAAFERVGYIYFHETDAQRLEDEMGYLLGEIEKREKKIRERYKFYPYDSAMYMYWLRLSSVYDYNKQSAKQEDALRKAHYHYDQVDVHEKIPKSERAQIFRDVLELESKWDDYPWKRKHDKEAARETNIGASEE